MCESLEIAIIILLKAIATVVDQIEKDKNLPDSSKVQGRFL